MDIKTKQRWWAWAHDVFLTSVVIYVFFYAAVSKATVCPTFTVEQEILLRKAHAIGQHDDWGYTLAAITWRESIVGDLIVRVNGQDGNAGSYGVAHMQVTTAMYLLGIDNIWEAKATLIPKMINNDRFALELSLTYLLRHEHLGWRGMIARYNGRGEAAQLYAEDVAAKALTIQQCLKLE